MSDQEILHPEDDEPMDTGNETESEEPDQSATESAGQVPEERDESPEAIIADLREKMQELESENSELKNQYLRKQADFENFRKRMNREKQEFAQFSNQQLLLDLVSVIDDFERAIKSADDSRDYDTFHDGVVMIEKQLTGMLQRKWGLTRYDSAGEAFDPQRHEAVAAQEVADDGEPVVLEEYQKGYTLSERVIRPAKVKVSTKREEQVEGE